MTTALLVANTTNPVSPDSFNTYEQTCDTANDLRAFTGVTGIQVYMRGLSAINDGGQGVFYWNAGIANPVDDNANVIVPNGSFQGAWSRIITALNAPIPNTITGTNAITLVPFNNTPPVTAYANFQLFTGVAAAAPTGPVTAQFGTLAALPVYLPNGSQAGAGAFRSGEFLMLAYVSSLNSGAGGFAVVNGLSSTSSTSPVTQIKIQKFLASGTYTPSVGLVYADIYCWGGGGAGGGVAGSSGGILIGGGGGAGQPSLVGGVTAAAIGSSQTVTVGAAGAPGAAGNNPGGSGGTSSVGTLCTAPGGSGGGAASGGSGGGGSGGSGGTSDIPTVGMNGSTGAFAVVLTVEYGAAGTGGSSSLGSGGSVGLTNSGTNAGNPGTGLASGGSGGIAGDTTSTVSGSPGTAGYVYIREYLSV